MSLLAWNFLEAKQHRIHKDSFVLWQNPNRYDQRAHPRKLRVIVAPSGMRLINDNNGTITCMACPSLFLTSALLAPSLSHLRSSVTKSPAFAQSS